MHTRPIEPEPLRILVRIQAVEQEPMRLTMLNPEEQQNLRPAVKAAHEAAGGEGNLHRPPTSLAVVGGSSERSILGDALREVKNWLLRYEPVLDAVVAGQARQLIEAIEHQMLSTSNTAASEGAEPEPPVAARGLH